VTADLGHTGVLLSFFGALAGAVVTGWGLALGRPRAVSSGRLYAALVLLGAVLSVVALERALVVHDFSLSYVAQNDSLSTPILYRVTGMWSALAGSMLLWSFLLSLVVGAMVFRYRRIASDPFVGWSNLVAYVLAAFFFGLMLGPADPFRTVAGPAPTNGSGPNVLLQNNPLIAVHPPLLYLGFVSFTAPFAFTIASLVTGRVGRLAPVDTRRWAMAAWGFLSAGIVLGALWSYQVLGWGGFWAWDPVENASFVPWLVATAYLHSSKAEERGGMLRAWSLALAIATFGTTILGTFLTRSGVIESVHAFSTSGTGPPLLVFLGIVVVASLALLGWKGDALRGQAKVSPLLTREGSLLVNSLLMSLFAFVVLLGTLFPLLYEAITARQVTVGSPYFDTMAMPIGMVLLVTMGIGPVLPRAGPGERSAPSTWERLLLPAAVGVLTVVAAAVAGLRGVPALAAFGLGAFAASSNVRELVDRVRGPVGHRAGGMLWRRRPTGRDVANARRVGGAVLRSGRVGGMVAHLGIVAIAVALAAASSFGHRGSLALRPGQSASFEGHRLTYLGTATLHLPSHTSEEALVLVDGRDIERPAVNWFGSDVEGVGSPAIDSNLLRDVYLTIDQLPASARGTTTLGIIVQPFVVWLWVGGALVVAGGFIALAGRRRSYEAADRRPVDEAEPARAIPDMAGVR
jgi:cytochrome c-type biogenesis protein CcmF